jgi:dTDP-4-dehydrorhamnose reductase
VKIALFGASGQVGGSLLKTSPPSAEIVAITRERLDFTDFASIRQAVSDIAPDVILNAAAYTAVDGAEAYQDLAFSINEHAVRVLARVAQTRGARLVHISTDYVFDGTAHSPYPVDAHPNPQSALSQKKWIRFVP